MIATATAWLDPFITTFTRRPRPCVSSSPADVVDMARIELGDASFDTLGFDAVSGWQLDGLPDLVVANGRRRLTHRGMPFKCDHISENAATGVYRATGETLAPISRPAIWPQPGACGLEPRRPEFRVPHLNASKSAGHQ